MQIVHNRILKTYLILCEGKDVENFMLCYLRSSALECDLRFGNDIQTLDFNGVDDLDMYLVNLTKMEGFESIRNILVLRDAETDVKKAKNEVAKAFSAAGLSSPQETHVWWRDSDSSYPNVSTAFTLFPACNPNPTEGALEDLCWEILKEQNATNMRDDVQGFVSDIMKKYGTVSTHVHKSRLHTYFSVNEKYISLKVGEAAKAGAFSWDSEKLSELKKLIAEGFTGT